MADKSESKRASSPENLPSIVTFAAFLFVAAFAYGVCPDRLAGGFAALWTATVGFFIAVMWWPRRIPEGGDAE